MRVPLVVAALCLVPSLVAAGSLGEAARREATKRAKALQGSRSYSDSDLSASPGAAPATPLSAEDGSGAPVPAEETLSGDALRAQLDRDEQERRTREQYWRDLARQALAAIERAQGELEDCRLRGG